MNLRAHFFTAALLLAPMLSAPLHAAELPGAGVLADIVLKQFDTNGDAKIDTGEWQAGITASFAEMDADGDGRITAEEMDAVGAGVGKEIGEAAGAVVAKLIKGLLLTMDADKDGVVSRDEFAKATGELFAKLDTNRDAELTRAELLLLPVKMLLPAGK